jgi:hypothetical protein
MLLRLCQSPNEADRGHSEGRDRSRLGRPGTPIAQRLTDITVNDHDVVGDFAHRDFLYNLVAISNISSGA